MSTDFTIPQAPPEAPTTLPETSRPTIEELQAQVNEQKQRKLQAFIAEIQATCERYNGWIEPKIVLTRDGVMCDLIYGVR